MKPVIIKSIIGLIIVAAIGVGVYRLQAPAASQRSWSGGGREARVIVEPVRFEPKVETYEAIGTSRAQKSVNVFAMAAGEVTALNFRAGMKVQKGDALLTLDNRRELLALEAAKVELKDAELALWRQAELVEKGTVTGAAADSARALRDRAAITVRQAQVELDDRTVRAPFSGFLGTTELDVGDRVTLDTVITSLDDRGSLLIEFGVPERFIDAIAVGQPVDLRSWQGDSARRTGAVVQVGSRVDPSSRSFAVSARLDNADDLFRPGQSFRVVMGLTGATMAVVPEIAVLWGSSGSYVWVVDDGKAQRRAIDIAGRQEGRVFAEGAIQAGELVVVEGLHQMRPGVPVTVEPGRFDQQPSLTAHGREDQSSGGAPAAGPALILGEE